MSSINTNLQAILAARTLDQTQNLLANSLERLSSGSKIVNPSDDPAGLAVSDKLGAQNLRVQAAATNVQNAISYVQTSDSFLAGTGSILSRLGELATMASDVTKTPADVALYQQEFSALQDQLRQTVGGSTAEIGGTTGVASPLGTFNGTELFGSTAGPTVSIGDTAGQQMTIPDTNLRAGSMLSIMGQDASGHYTLQASDPGAIAAIAAATQQVGGQRATMGAAESRLQLVASTLQVQSQNLGSTISGISDVDVAQESTQLAKYNILVQAGTAMLAQANQDPQNVLKLLNH